MEFKLHLTGPEGEKQVLDLNDHAEINIGRGPRQDVQLLDPEQWMSREHLVVINTEDGPIIKVKGTNGLTVEGRQYNRGQQASVEHGDMVEMGHWVMEVRANIPMDVLEVLNAPPEPDTPPEPAVPPPEPPPKPVEVVSPEPEEDRAGWDEDLDLSNLTDDPEAEPESEPRVRTSKRRSWWARAWSADRDEQSEPSAQEAEDETLAGPEEVLAPEAGPEEEQAGFEDETEDWAEDVRGVPETEVEEDAGSAATDAPDEAPDDAPDDTPDEAPDDAPEEAAEETLDESPGQAAARDGVTEETEAPDEAGFAETAEPSVEDDTRAAAEGLPLSQGSGPEDPPEVAPEPDQEPEPEPVPADRRTTRVNRLSQLRKDLARRAPFSRPITGAPEAGPAPPEAPEPEPKPEGFAEPEADPTPAPGPASEAEPQTVPDAAPEPGRPPAATTGLPSIRPCGHGFFHAPHLLTAGSEEAADLVLPPDHPMTEALRETLTAALVAAGVDEADLASDGLTMHVAARLTGDPRYLQVAQVGTDQELGPEDQGRFGWLIEPLMDGYSLMTLDITAEAEAGGHAFRVAIHGLPHSVEIVDPD